MSWSTDSIGEVYSSLDTSPDGLTGEEANRRIEEYGKNRLGPEINGSFGYKLISLFLEPNTSLLLATSAISAVLTILNNEYPYEFLIIIAIIAINASYFIVHHAKSDKFIYSLKNKTSPLVTVIRDKEETEIFRSELVPGDIVRLKKGDTVTADCRIIKCENLKVEESNIRNSDNTPINKYSTQILGITDEEIDFKDMNNMLFMSSTVINGSATAVVTATGLSTLFGKSFDIVATARKNKTPLQLKLHDATNWHNIIVMVVCGLVLLGKFITVKISGGTLFFVDSMDKIMVTLALSITAMPQGLVPTAGAIISSVLEDMSVSNIIFKRHEKAELVSSVQVLITDLRKTGNVKTSEIKKYDAVNKQAGITPIYITNDTKEKVLSSPKYAPLYERQSQVIERTELENLTDSEMESQFREYKIYCGISDKTEEKIIDLWRKDNCITAVTASSNDNFQIIKKADLTIATDKNENCLRTSSCDAIISKNHLFGITKAIESGRNIYYNTRKFFIFTTSNNLAALLTILVATILNFNILSTVQLLWINLVTDTFTASALSQDRFGKSYMIRKPKDTRTSLYSDGALKRIVTDGVIITVLTLLSYFIGEVYNTGIWKFAWVTDKNGEIGTTMAFITMSLVGLFNALNMRSDTLSLFVTEKAKNRNNSLYITYILAIGLSIIAVRVPMIANIFGFTIIAYYQYITAIALAFLIIPISELIKFIKRKQKTGVLTE